MWIQRPGHREPVNIAAQSAEHTQHTQLHGHALQSKNGVTLTLSKILRNLKGQKHNKSATIQARRLSMALSDEISGSITSYYIHNP